MKKTIKLLAIILIAAMLMPFTVVNANSSKVEDVIKNINKSDVMKEFAITAKYEDDNIGIQYTSAEDYIKFQILEEGEEDEKYEVIKYESGNITNYEEAKAAVINSDYFQEFIVPTVLKLNGYTEDEINDFFQETGKELNYELNGIEMLEIGGVKTFTSDNEGEGTITTLAKSMKINLKKANLKTSKDDTKSIPGTTVAKVIDALKENSMFSDYNRITSADNSIEIKQTNTVYYPCKDGILTYESGEIKDFDQAFDVLAHHFWAYTIIRYALAANGYTYEEINDFLSSESNNFNYELNGIELLEIGGEQKIEKGTQTVTATALSLKIDFEKANIEKENKIEEYEVLEGANQTYKIGKDTKLTFRFDIDYDTFKTYGDVWLDQIRIEEDNYTSESGSTIITFNDEFTNKLSEGEHHLEVSLAQDRLGVAKTDFTIEKANTTSNPKTGDNIAIWVSLIVVSMLGITGTIVFAKKNK